MDPRCKALESFKVTDEVALSDLCFEEVSLVVGEERMGIAVRLMSNIKRQQAYIRAGRKDTDGGMGMGGGHVEGDYQESHSRNSIDGRPLTGDPEFSWRLKFQCL